MKRKWPQTRVGCLQYQVKVEKKNEDMWSYLKKDVFKKTRDAIFDYGVNDIPNIKESRHCIQGIWQRSEPLQSIL